MTLLRTSALVLLPLTLAGCTRERQQPRTQAEFIEAYRSAYNAGDEKAVLALVKWDGVPDEMRKV